MNRSSTAFGISGLPASYLSPSVCLGLCVNSFTISQMEFQGLMGEVTAQMLHGLVTPATHAASKAVTEKHLGLGSRYDTPLLPWNIGEHGLELT